jgi:hypothetical protein
MSRTVRRHESLAKQKRRGPKNRPDEDAPKAKLKSHKQIRPNDRTRLRKEYL